MSATGFSRQMASMLPVFSSWIRVVVLGRRQALGVGHVLDDQGVLGGAHLRADGLERIEAGHGVLQDHADLLAAHAEPVLLLFELGKVA